ncbi:hypothetical protein [Prevotella sp. tc2-28]|uniref:hypothetical protein n=1 Tax=Prevotella sp. tc2-28 TaxID=1761888 RepID=UPI000B85AD90|nr:hypothetical protein [Prevotella sp. tc2-28]
MRKVLFLFLCAFMMSTSVYAWDIIPFTVSIDDDDMPIGNGYPKAPMQAPTVYIEDYSLSFVADHPEYILNIKDEDGEVVYSTVVYSTLTQVTLPSILSGEYVIELRMGYWLFTGWIEL